MALMTNFKTCTRCDGTGHGDADCGRNRVFGCVACDGLGAVENDETEE